MSRDVFSKLEKLLDENRLEEYREEVLRLQEEEPETFEDYLEYWRLELSRAPWATRTRRLESMRALFAIKR